ncbi:MAG: AraC family transcriptional regulator [Prevotella sp.]|nr:AraC family transcriptional regulator [Prevotella sp.]
MQELYFWAFFVGVSTTYFAIHAAQLFRNKSRTRLQTILAWLMVVWAVICLKDLLAFYMRPSEYGTHNLLIILDGWVTFTYTILLFELTAPGWTTRRHVIITSLPFLAFTLVYIVWPDFMVIDFYILFLIIYSLTLFIIVFVRAIRYTKYILSNYSNIEEKDISWIKNILLLALLSQATWIAATFFPSILSDSVYYFCMLFMWQLAINYSRCLRQDSMLQDPIEQQPVVQAPESARSYSFAGLLENTVERDELYLNQDLTLVDLAKAVNTNRTYLSAYFSNVKQTTFYEYINQLRITKKSLPMMREHPEYTLEYVAAASGFKSISTFRRAFIKFTGTSPSQYSKQ